MHLEVFGAGDERIDRALAVRRAVFMAEQGIPEELEIDEHDTHDPRAVHVVAFEDGVPLGTGRMYDNGDGSVQIGRMAVLEGRRGGGCGSLLLGALLDEAARRGYREARLDAQLPAAAFYRRHGFRENGARRWDAGILHQPMSRSL